MRYHAPAGIQTHISRSGTLIVCEPAAVYAGPCRRVLLVDDDVAALEIGALLLADAGVQVEVAPSAEAALRLAAGRAFDLLIVDYRLGDETGIDLVRRLRAGGVATPFILVTGHASVSLTVEAMRLGARTVLEKPLIGEAFVTPVLREIDAIEGD